jgi:methyl-accepting chemotaxis protein
MSRNFQRKKINYFLIKNFQGKVILRLFLAVMGGILLFTLLLALFSADTMTIRYSNSDIQVGATPLMLFKSAVMANWVFIVLGGAVLVILGIITSHRVAGPLYHFEKTLRAMAAGNLAYTIHLREKDEGKALAKCFNLFNETMSGKLHSIKDDVEELEKILEEMSEGEENTGNLEQLNRAAKERVTTLRGKLDFFKLNDETPAKR